MSYIFVSGAYEARRAGANAPYQIREWLHRHLAARLARCKLGGLTLWIDGTQQDPSVPRGGWMGLRDGGLVDEALVQDHFSNAEEYVKFVNDVQEEKKSYEQIRKSVFDS